MINDTVCQETYGNATVSQEINGTKTADIREGIAKAAEGFVGSPYWAFGAQTTSAHGKYTYKCNIFVNDICRQSGATMPDGSIDGGYKVPVMADENGWGDPKAKLKCWTKKCTPQRGDIVVACRRGDYHIGIYVGKSTTVSAMGRKIEKNAWPLGEGRFKGENIIYWRYTC